MKKPESHNSKAGNSTDKVTTLADKSTMIVQKIRGFLFSEYTPPLLLPESIRYALAYNKGEITKAHIENILNNTRFEAIGLYLTLRYLQKTPQKRACLQEICQSLTSTRDSSYKTINAICKKHIILREHDSMQAGKLGYFSRIGFDIDRHFHHAFSRNPLPENTTPVISLYAGLLGLPTLCYFYRTKPILFCDPKSGLILGFNTPGLNNTLGVVDNTILNHIPAFAIIDDAIGSGETLEKIENILCTSRSDIPQFTHIIATKKFSH